MPKRPWDYKLDGESANVGDWGVAVTGNNGTARAALWGAAIGGDGAKASFYQLKIRLPPTPGAFF
jgi:hypothetical protein